jgi:hypothetical protein
MACLLHLLYNQLYAFVARNRHHNRLLACALPVTLTLHGRNPLTCSHDMYSANYCAARC